MAIGGAADIIHRIKQFADAGIYKFILRPIGTDDDDIMEQTRLLSEQVIPAVQGKDALK